MTINYIVYTAIFLLAAACVWLAMRLIWMKARLREEEAMTDRAIKAKGWFYSWAMAEMDKLRAALTEKDRIIDSIRKENKDQAYEIGLLEDMEKGRRAEVNHLCKRCSLLYDILIRVHPYSRLIIHDPAKLEAWLEKLKGKKGAKRHKPGSFQTGGFKDMVHETINTQTIKNQ